MKANNEMKRRKNKTESGLEPNHPKSFTKERKFSKMPLPRFEPVTHIWDTTKPVGCGAQNVPKEPFLCSSCSCVLWLEDHRKLESK